MSGGSLDDHICAYDRDHSWWLPLYENETIVEQPVKINELSLRYAARSTDFIKRKVDSQTPFFLLVAFSHVHQLCAPKDRNEQASCQWARSSGTSGLDKSFGDAVKEMDWIAGQILDALDSTGVSNNTLVLFTSDNGPWLAEQSCSGSQGPFEGRWLAENTDISCTACPHDFVPDPTPERPRRCRLKDSTDSGSGQENHFLDGVHCGADVGLGSVWEANLRMPAFARFPGKIQAGTTTNASVSTLDVFPTLLNLTGAPVPTGLDGIDISPVLFGHEDKYDGNNRVLFFWRDGFSEGSLPAPFGRMDIAAVKVGHIKAWYYTKSAHYNDDPEVHHDPPLLFDTQADPAEANPLNPNEYTELIARIEKLVKEHKESIDWTYPLALAKDPEYRPCADRANDCRTRDPFLEDVDIEG
jgi:arylsulfatase A-like enzyme